MEKKNKNISELDVNQMDRLVFDEKMDANRVVIVNWDQIANAIVPGTINTPLDYQNHLKNSIPSTIEKIEVPTIIKEQEIKIIEVPHIVIQKEIERVEIPVIIKQYEKIEVPVIVKEKEIIEKFADGKIITKSIIPKWFTIAFIIQSLILVGMIIKYFI